jgi:pimeloyl-ACP methyl ester carboxylesterase
MKSTSIPLLILVGGLTTGWTEAATVVSSAKIGSGIQHRPELAHRKQISSGKQRIAQTRVPVSATKNAKWTTCQPEATDLGALCGTVDVPLDRDHPDQRTIAIYFELYTHAGTGVAESAILVNFGGPGLSTTAFRDTALGVFEPNLDKHDLLLIDDRGRGLSGAIDCPDLQHGTAPWDEAVARCAAQLGLDASRYGTGDVAIDTDAVRAALGYEKVDYYGASYGGADVSAYATRFGGHLRSIVLDAPFAAPNFRTFEYARSKISADFKMVTLDCNRSPTCSADHPHPAAELNALVWRIRLHPVEGDAYDASGNLVHVRIDELALFNFLIDTPNGKFTNTGELLAAAASLCKGDSKPLLRMAAEGYHPMERDFGDPAFLSNALYVGTAAVDGPEPWDWSVPVPMRAQQFAGAVSALPPFAFAPFSKRVASDLIFSYARDSGRHLLAWEIPTPPAPIEPPHAQYPHPPALALSGDMDNGVPTNEASKVTALFHTAPLQVAGSGHATVFFSQCARDLISHFVQTFEVGDTSCLATPETVWPAVDRFPLLARNARPAEVDPNGQNEIGLCERKVATVAVGAALDAWRRILMGSAGQGKGLRGGSFSLDPDRSTLTLTDYVFAEDVIVNGTALWQDDSSFSAALTVEGAGTAGGQLSVQGSWIASGPVAKFKISGKLGGKEVHLLLPQA